MASLKKHHYIIPILLSILILAVGIFSAQKIGDSVEKNQRRELEVHAKNAALLINPSDVKALSSSDSDIEKPEYQRLKQALIWFRENNEHIRFVYLLGYNETVKKVFFYVDSELPTSRDYSPPGQIFEDTTEGDITGFFNAVPYTDGPYTDSWGTWVSGYAPVKDRNTGELIAEIGIDIDTHVWNNQILFVQTVVTIIGILLALLAFAVAIAMRKKQTSIETLKTVNKELKNEEAKLLKTQELAQVGRFIVYLAEQTVLVDALFAPLFQIQSDQKVALTDFFSRVHADDLDIFVKAIAEMKESKESYHSFDIRITTGDGQYRSYHIYGNVERNSANAPERYAGIIQDITDIAK